MSNIDKQAHQVSRYDLVSGYMQKWPDGEFVYHSDYQALLDELEAKDKRIAELEERDVVLPSTQDVHPLGPQSAKIFWEFHRSIVNRCADEIRKVGVKVSIKGN